MSGSWIPHGPRKFRGTNLICCRSWFRHAGQSLYRQRSKRLKREGWIAKSRCKEGKGGQDNRLSALLFIASGFGFRRSFLRARRRLALRQDGVPQPAAQIVRKFVQMRVAINFDGHLGGVADDIAVMAPLEVVFQLRPCLGVHRVVQVIGELFQKVRASHFLPSPPVRFLKYLFKRSRNCSRARSRRDLTAGTLKSKASAVSSVERPSTSRKTKTVRKLGGNP